MTKYVEWFEPYGPKEVCRISKISLEDIIIHMKEYQEQYKNHPNYPYKTDQEAIDDFICINFGRIVDE